MEFYSTQKKQLKQFLESNAQVRSVIVLGSTGLGKSKIIKDVASQTDFTIFN